MAGLHKYEFGVYILVCMDGRKAENDAKKEGCVAWFFNKKPYICRRNNAKTAHNPPKRRKFEDT